MMDISELISVQTSSHLEEMAAAAHALTVRRFGRTIRLYAPVYLSNECINGCVYCGFNSNAKIERKTLSVDEAVDEANAIMDAGHRHILLVSGEHPERVSLDYLCSIAAAIRERAAGITIEVQPMDEPSYRRLAAAGVDGVTLYQETYDEGVYRRMHPAGPKKTYGSRMESIDAAGRAGMRSLGIGALLGLADWRSEALSLVSHARDLMRRHWRSHIAISVPRIRDSAMGFAMPNPVSDRDLVQMICALRLALPDCGIVLSTREPAALRNRLLPLGITQMSAGSVTSPGGYTRGGSGEQFHIEDTRSPEAVASMLKSRGYDPVWKDWERTFDETRMD